MSESKSVKDIIVHFQASNELTNDAYGSLIKTVVDNNIYSKLELNTYLATGEKDYMDTYYPDHYKLKDGSIVPAKSMTSVPIGSIYCKSKKGYKYRTFLPNAYTSAKSVIGNALDRNIPLRNSDGTFVGKSALQIGITFSKSGPYEAAKKSLFKASKYYGVCSDNERKELDKLVNSYFSR